MNWREHEARRLENEARQKAQGARKRRSRALKRGPTPKQRKARERALQQGFGRDLAAADAVCSFFWALHGYPNVSTVAVGLGLQGFFFGCRCLA